MVFSGWQFPIIPSHAVNIYKKSPVELWTPPPPPNRWWNLATGDIAWRRVIFQSPKKFDCTELMRVRFSIDYMATPLHKNLCPGGHEIFLDRFLVIIIIHWVCMDHAPEKRRRFFFFKNTSILYFLPKYYLPLRWGGVMKFTVSCLLTIRMLHNKLD